MVGGRSARPKLVFVSSPARSELLLLSWPARLELQVTARTVGLRAKVIVVGDRPVRVVRQGLVKIAYSR